MSIETLIEYITLFGQGDETIPARKKLLVEQREQIAEKIDSLKKVVARLDYKIDGYEERMVKYKQEHLK